MAAKKKTAAKKKATRRKPAAREADAPPETEVAPVEAEKPADPTPVAAEPPREATPARASRLVRGRGRPRAPAANPAERTQRVIPPLPDEEDEFVPYAAPPPPAREEERDPRRLLEAVRRGDTHVRALDVLGDDALRALAESEGVAPREGERRSETIYRLVESGLARPREETVMADGLLELHPDGYGFLRRPERSYAQHPGDVYVAANLVRRHALRPGLWISGTAKRKRPDHPDLALTTVEEVNHESPARLEKLTAFDQLTVVYPDQRFVLETTPEEIEMRVMDLFCPLGMGQRALIVAPPRSGKTIMLQKLADAIATNAPGVDIVVLLVDERPEEVTNMKRSVRGEVIASTFDKPATNHVRIAELVMEKVKRMVEFGRDVVLLLDSITRLGRAYNNQAGGSGRILTGGLDANALTKPKRFFGSARNVEGGGSLTIVATALVDTGSRMDDVIFEEFKGTGNMELVLSRDLANARIWPAIDIPASGTRNEDLLLHPDELRRVTLLRRGVTGQDPQAVMIAIRDQLRKNKTNAEFLLQLGN
jgi:transcription termination factor Rho